MAGLSTNLAIEVDEKALSELCRRYHIRKLSVFGSASRTDFGPDSDIDLLVEYEPGHTPGWEIVDIGEALSTFFGGRKIDLVNPKYLNRRLRQRVLNDAAVCYEASSAS